MKTNYEKTCENCRYFLHHYIKQCTRYTQIFCGHCINQNNKDRHKKKPIEICGFWETVEIQKEARKKSIKETLTFMSEQLNEITMILKDDVD